MKPGELRKALADDRVFLVVDIENDPLSPAGPAWVTYIIDGKMCYDDSDWLEENSEVLDETR
jgi:hypothetical protein